MNRTGCDLDLVFDVINALNDARINIIEPIKTAMLRLGETEEMEEYHADLPTLEKMIESLLGDGKNIFEIYEILASPSRAMPLDGRYEFVNSLDMVPDATGRDLLICPQPSCGLFICSDELWLSLKAFPQCCRDG